MLGRNLQFRKPSRVLSPPKSPVRLHPVQTVRQTILYNLSCSAYPASSAFSNISLKMYSARKLLHVLLVQTKRIRFKMKITPHSTARMRPAVFRANLRRTGRRRPRPHGTICSSLRHPRRFGEVPPQKPHQFPGRQTFSDNGTDWMPAADCCSGCLKIERQFQLLYNSKCSHRLQELRSKNRLFFCA